jgi:hypothetical protein
MLPANSPTEPVAEAAGPPGAANLTGEAGLVENSALRM